VRKLLNTLFITSPDAYLACDNENIVVKIDREIKFRMPIHNIEGIVCFGYAGASPGLMALCCERGIALSFLTEYGRYQGRVTGSVHGNVLLRKTQYRWSENAETTARLAKRFVQAKIANSRLVLQRALRDHEYNEDENSLQMTVRWLSDMPERLEKTNDLEKIRGIEGEAAHLYFGCFDSLIIAQKDDFKMEKRVRRPPTDNVNALLSFVYTLLAHEVTAALETVGLDPQVGFLHCDRPGRASLAMDMMEELRPYMADRLVLSLINRRQINSNGFNIKESGAVLMTDETRKIVLTAWQKRKQEELTHLYLDEKINVGLIPYTQAMIMARHMRGDIEDYPPFFWR